jgi:hypothetical protein
MMEHNLFTSPNISSVIKSRGMRWMRHVAHMRLMRNTYKICLGILKGRNKSEDLDVDLRIIVN